MRCLYCHSVIAAEPTLVSLFKRDETLCLTCREKLTFKFPGERCGRCHQLVNKKTEVCSDCELLIGVYPHINKIYTVTDYNEETKMLMHRYKFVKDYALAEVLALLCSFSFKPYHAVVPIPVSKVRLKERTYNQTSAVLDVLGIKYAELLGTKKSKRQSDLTRHERLNSENPFYLKENVRADDFSGMNIVIIDDIYTTGTTVHQAAEIISTLNFQNIDVLTFSKTQHI